MLFSMDCSDSPFKDKCRFGCCQVAATQAPEQSKVDGGATAAHTAGEVGGACVQDSGCGKNISNETDAMIKEGGFCGKTPNENATRDGCGLGCYSSSSIAPDKEQKSVSIRHVDAKVNAGCYGSTSTLDEDNTTGKASTLTITTAAGKCGAGCCSGSGDPKSETVEGTSTSFEETAFKVEGSQTTGCQDKCCSSENTPVPAAACESYCCEDVLEKEATKQVTAVSSNDGDSDCCAGKKAPCCSGKWP